MSDDSEDDIPRPSRRRPKRAISVSIDADYLFLHPILRFRIPHRMIATNALRDLRNTQERKN